MLYVIVAIVAFVLGVLAHAYVVAEAEKVKAATEKDAAALKSAAQADIEKAAKKL